MRTTCTSNSTGPGENTLMLQMQNIFRLNVTGDPGWWEKVEVQNGNGVCAGRQEQGTAEVIEQGLCAEYSSKTHVKYIFSWLTPCNWRQQKYQGFGELLKKRFIRNLSFEVLLKLMSSLVVSPSSVFHSECKPEMNLPSNWKSSTTCLCFRGLTRDRRKEGTKCIVTIVTTASRPCAVAGR